MFADMIADMESNKKLSPEVNELILRGRKRFFIHLLLYHYLISKLQD